MKALIRAFSFVKNTNIKIVDFTHIFKEEPETNNYYYKSFDIAFANIMNELSVEANMNGKNMYIFIGIGSYKEKLNDNGINYLNAIINNVNNYMNSYFVFFDSYVSYKNIQTNNIIKPKINSSNGIWIGDGVGSQIAIHINNLTMDDRKLNFPFMGVAVSNEFKEIIKCFIDDSGDENEQ